VNGIDVELGHGLVELADDAGIDLPSVVSREIRRIQDVLHAPETTMTIALGVVVIRRSVSAAARIRATGR
jgi:hypothetical protein